MNDEANPLQQVVSVLEGMGVPYMIGGSVALAVWAAPRTTHDLDLVVNLPTDRIIEFCSHFSTDRYFIDPDVRRAAFERSSQPSMGMYSFTDMETELKVDLFPLRPNDPAQSAALIRRIIVEIL